MTVETVKTKTGYIARIRNIAASKLQKNYIVTVSDRINVSGDVHLILCDNATLIASKGIGVTGNNSLTVYAQSTGDSMGALIATGPISHARLYRSRRLHLQGVFRQWGDAYRRYADNAR